MRKILTAILLIALCASLAACAAGGDGGNGTATDTSAQSDTASLTGTAPADSAPASDPVADNAEETFPIEFAGLTLYYPKKWQDSVTVTTTDRGSLLFSAGDTDVFELFADSGEGILIGTVKGETYTVITAEFNDDAAEDETIAAMQEDVNVILQHLISDYDFEPGVALYPEDDAVFPIETSVTTLYYPAKWKDLVDVEVTKDQVAFSCDGTAIFELVFHECGGYLLGTYGDTPIYIVDYMLENETHAAMQEDVNVILQHLMEDEKFTVNIG